MYSVIHARQTTHLVRRRNKRAMSCEERDRKRMASCDCALARLPSGYINLPLPPSTAVSSITQIFSNILTWALFKILQTADRCLSVCFSAQKRIYLYSKPTTESICLFVSSKAHICFCSKETIGRSLCLSVCSNGTILLSIVSLLKTPWEQMHVCLFFLDSFEPVFAQNNSARGPCLSSSLKVHKRKSMFFWLFSRLSKLEPGSNLAAAQIMSVFSAQRSERTVKTKHVFLPLLLAVNLGFVQSMFINLF